MTKSILIVDDNKDIRKLLKKTFSYEDFKCYEASTGESALEILSLNSLDIVILDINLAGIMNGFDVLKVLRSRDKFSHIPVVIISGTHKKADDIINTFNLGSDDYVVKPFSPKVLLARVKAVLRRSDFSEAVKGVLNINNIFIDKKSRSVKVLGKQIDLRHKEFELLWVLAEKKGSVLTRDFLCERVMGYEYFGSSRAIDAHIKNLRKALGERADMIKTVRGAGYKMVVKDGDQK